MKFKKGDRVKVTGNYGKDFKDSPGVVLAYDGDHISVEFDNHIDGHDGDGSGKQGYCWKLPISMVTRVNHRGRPSKEKPPMFIVTYDLRSGDPSKVFYSRKELNDWILKAHDDS